MIRIARNYSAKGIPAGFRGSKRIDRQRLLLDKLRAGISPEDLVFSSAVWKPAKVSLKKETGGKCAYCEVPAAGRSRSKAKGGLVAHCDVEHFRPKDLYWWLAHSFENYLLSCQVCNQSFKGNQFPVAARLTAPVVVNGNESDAELDALADLMAPDPLVPLARNSWEAVLQTEDADLADPLHEDPALLFSYTTDDVLREVAIAPRASAGRAKERAESTISILGLEREELRFARYDVYRTVHTFRKVLSDPGIHASTRSDVEEELARLMGWWMPFAGMVRYFVQDVWQLAISAKPRD